MKGYYELKEKEKSKIIESYKIDGDKIIVHMVNDDELTYNNTKEILESVKNSQEKSYHKFNKKELKRNQIFFTIGCITATIGTISFLYGTIIINPLCFPLCLLFPSVMANYLEGIFKDQKELKKQSYYMNNKEIYSDEILDNNNITKCLPQVKQNRLEIQRQKTGSAFNLTSIDVLDLEDLKKLKINLERERELDICSIETIENPKQKVINK